MFALQVLTLFTSPLSFFFTSFSVCRSVRVCACIMYVLVVSCSSAHQATHMMMCVVCPAIPVSQAYVCLGVRVYVCVYVCICCFVCSCSPLFLPFVSQAMHIAGKLANKHGVHVVIDPVGAGAISYRNRVTNELLADVRTDILRGNASEIIAVAGSCAELQGKLKSEAGTTRGCDASHSTEVGHWASFPSFLHSFFPHVFLSQNVLVR